MLLVLEAEFFAGSVHGTFVRFATLGALAPLPDYGFAFVGEIPVGKHNGYHPYPNIHHPSTVVVCDPLFVRYHLYSPQFHFAI